MTKDRSGPAFPVPAELCQDLTIEEQRGMTLRDWFAGKAMTTMFYPAIMESIRTDNDLDCLKVAEFAYAMADAMLAARQQ